MLDIVLFDFAASIASAFVFQSSVYEPAEQGMRLVWSAFKFGMVLYAYKIRMVRQLDSFYQTIIRRCTAYSHPLINKLAAVCVVEFKSVTMTFTDQVFSV